MINVSIPGDCPVVATTEFGEPRTTPPRELARGVDHGSLAFRCEGGLVTVTSEATEAEDPARCLEPSFEGPLKGTAVRLDRVEREELEEEADGAGEGKRGGATAGV